MSNPISISFNKHQAALATSTMVGAVSHQVAQTASLDEQPGVDTAPGQGKVAFEDHVTLASLEYEPATGVANKFSFRAKEDIQAQAVVPKGMETSFQRTPEGVETYTQSLPTPDGGKVSQEAVLDPATETITYNNDTKFTFQENQVSQAAAGLVATVNQQIGQFAGLDEKQGVDTAPGRGTLRADDTQSSVALDYDPATGVASSFDYEIRENIQAANGTLLFAKGTKSSMKRQSNGLETYSTTRPTTDGNALHQEVSVDPNSGTLTYDEWIVNG